MLAQLGALYAGYVVLSGELGPLLGDETVLKVWGVLVASQVPGLVALLVLDRRVSSAATFVRGRAD